MTTRARPVRRIARPLVPEYAVLIVDGDSVIQLEPSQVTLESVGLKAYGLASLPPRWTRPFFAVSGPSPPTSRALNEALARAGLDTSKKLIVRSSGVDESIESRGNLDSAETDVKGLEARIGSLNAALASRNTVGEPRVHWVVQKLLPALAKGHLSNERRVAENKRDWVAEVEASVGHQVETRSISLRTWRDNRPPSEDLLTCPYRASYTQCLTTVARWAYERLVRVHFEWVWDGYAVYIVQADNCDGDTDGVDPKSLVQASHGPLESVGALRLFREATPADYETYRKLANVRLYRKLGYDMVPFYVMDDQAEIQRIVDEGTCSQALRNDLERLVFRPLVIRTDGRRVPDDLKEMLPRSEELRSTEEAQGWLFTTFREQAIQRASESKLSLVDCTPCLIAHHFVPAVAAAWCQARPDQRRVRIESLWGLPEGLYWYAYDAFDVDTLMPSAALPIERPRKMPIRERRRFKERFVAPDAMGRWVLQRTAAGPDWQRSIKRTEWIEEVAWTSRQIAAEVGGPVVVMWFVDVPPKVSKHRVMPWFHAPWKADASLHKAAPRRKLSATTDFVLRSKADWEQLKTRVENGDPVVRVRVQPNEPEIVRDRAFADDLAAFAKKHKLVVELEGGVLSHAYYMLSRAGCTVECADLDDYATDEFGLEFNKLVRDEIPASIAARGESVTVLRLEGEALIASLRRKLVEESLEVLDARNKEEIAEELADLREVTLALMSKLGITEPDIEARRKRKAKSRGGFEKALMLVRTAVAPSMDFRELQVDEGVEQNIASSTIHREAAIPSAPEDIHVDKRVDALGITEGQFTVHLPAHASGYQSTRVSFSLPTVHGEVHEMAFELLLERSGSDLRARARVMNAPVQLDLKLDPSDDGSP